MKHFAVSALCAAALALSSQAQTKGEFFPSDPASLKENKVTKLRGIINVVHLPLPDDLELGKSQSGFFLFTPNPIDADISSEDGTELVKSQQMFHLVLSEEQLANVKKLLQKPVEVTASPFGAHTRHHRTPVLLNVASIRLLPSD